MSKIDPKLTLPKPHISWSQLLVWNTSKTRYEEEYFTAESKLKTDYLDFGSSISSQIENGTIQELLPELVVYPSIEHEIKVVVGGVPLLIYIDSFDPESTNFREYKTGKWQKTKKGPKPAWDRAKVQKHGQLLFYAVGIRAKYGKMPERCHLDWIPTLEEKREEEIPTGPFSSKKPRIINTTGEIFTFEREFDERELDWMEAEIVRVAHEISEAYQAFGQTL